MVSEAIILAGGFGTRLKDVITDLPKPMAPINNRPFLDFILDHLADQGVRHAVISTGYRSEILESNYGGKYKSIRLTWSVEKTPLGTGGAIALGARHIASRNFLVVNGDTLFLTELKPFTEFHLLQKADITVALKEVDDSTRYGRVTSDKAMKITAFTEKGGKRTPGFVNGGQYLIRREFLNTLVLPESFSLERELLEPGTTIHRFFGFKSNGYFIDIGTPGDYEKACRDLT